jgi:hypothetical protein
MPRKSRASEPGQSAFHASARRRAWGACLAGFALLLGACAGIGGGDNPIFRSFGWFRFLDAGDLRQSCSAGRADRYRLVYNAVWGEQVRIYEITAAEPPAGAAAGALLATRVLFPENLNDIDPTDPLRLYRGKNAAVALGPSDLAALRRLLSDSGFDGPPPIGATLPSDGFYWVVAACENGVFHYNAYDYPSPRFAAISFDRWLFAHDRSGVPVAAPHPSAPRPTNRSQLEEAGYSTFDLVVGADGLRALP